MSKENGGSTLTFLSIFSALIKSKSRAIKEKNNSIELLQIYVVNSIVFILRYQ